MLKVGETDIDSTDIWRFTFHSDYPTLKIATGGSQTFTINAGNSYGELEVVHSLGYKPFYLVNVYYGGKSYNVSATTIPFYAGSYIELPNTDGWDSIITFYAYVSNSSLFVGASTADGLDLTSTATFTGYWTVHLDEF